MSGFLLIGAVVSWAVLLVAALRVGPVLADYWRAWRAAR